MEEKSGQLFLLIQGWEAIGAGSSGSSLLITTIATSAPSPGEGKDLCKGTGWPGIAWITAMWLTRS